MSDEKQGGGPGAWLPGDAPVGGASAAEGEPSASQAAPAGATPVTSQGPAPPEVGATTPSATPGNVAPDAPTSPGASPPAPLAPPTTQGPLAGGGLRFLPSPSDMQRTPAWQWLAVGLGGTLLVFGLARVAGSSLQEPPRPLSPPVAANQDLGPRPLPAPPSLLTVTARPIGDLPPTESLESLRGDAGRRSAFARRDKKHPPSKYSFPTEGMALDAARSALDAKDTTRALAILDQYDRDYPGELSSTDARALRIEALAQAHKSDEAMRLADQFLEDYPHSPRADRVRALKQALASQ